MTKEELTKIAQSCGFTTVADLDVDTLVVRPEIRETCTTNKCRQYDTKWSCPPGCGTLEEMEQLIRRFKNGLILQTTGELPDSLDFEQMGAIAAKHYEHMTAFSKQFRKLCPDGYVVGDTPCFECKECTYPDEPCRFPELLSYSLSALGIVVSDMCKSNDVKYYYGAGTLTYVGCVFID